MLLTNKRVNTSIPSVKTSFWSIVTLAFHMQKEEKMDISGNGQKAFQGYMRLNHVKLTMSNYF